MVGHNPKAMQSQLQEAWQQHRAGNLSAAKSAYKKILTVDPNCAQALHLLGILLSQQGDLALAAHYLQKAVKLEPEQSVYHNNLANALVGLKRYEEALSHYQQALRLNPEYAEAYNNLGNVYYRQQHWEQAVACYSKATSLQPDYVEAHRNLGLVLLQQNKLAEAEKQFRNVLALHPMSVSGHYQLANLYLQRAQYTQAIHHYQQALCYQPQHIEALNNLAVAYLRQGEPVQAIACFTKVLEQDPEHLPARSNLAATFLQQDRFIEASQHYRFILQHRPQDLEAHYNLGFAYMMLEEIEQAIVHFQAAIDQRPDYADAYANLGACYLKSGQRDAAIKHYQKALALCPNNPTVEFMLAALTGQQPVAPPKEFVRDLFDNYAFTFDKHLTQHLGYQVPQHLYQAVTQLNSQARHSWRILELGCGTGLCATLFKPLASYLVGVDLSAKMLRMAAEKGLYDELIEEDMVSYVNSQNKEWDIILAADVLVYVGDLMPLFEAVHRALVHNGIFAFTTEISETCEFTLQPHGRYAHSRAYIERLARVAGFTVAYYERVTARLQENQPLLSHLYVMKINK